jgi:ABC-type molybdate transport system substrate-binding protein
MTQQCIMTSASGTDYTFQYTNGRVILWSQTNQGKWDTTTGIIDVDEISELSLADIIKAPYGTAANEVLVATSQRNTVWPKVVQYDNISLTFQAVQSDSTKAGFVAKSQPCRGGTIAGEYFEYDVQQSNIAQSGAAINISSPVTSNAASLAFVNFLMDDSQNGGQTVLVNIFCYGALSSVNNAAALLYDKKVFQAAQAGQSTIQDSPVPQARHASPAKSLWARICDKISQIFG